ncbi:hypothetical protein BN8_p06831 (plasmid) [Fibrisoma limi BUZ 3]|uniref:Uncharacterized protein n=1 Tax=Fibrisoma limi BUZ 3 TaxID=1185876 RepID=I2GU32_9BACT|nr:hypothetical protein [Fibrisoma limi]CCH57633.1 hypothetical protein BN8_p06831 [Fibrisoma limi BUZ 3]
MLAQQEEVDLARCRRLIERQIDFGSPEGWTTGDFDRLSADILSRTGVCLSVTTLKRVWGKVKYDSSPTLTTLNALVQFIGYANWYDFQQPTSGENTGSRSLVTPAPLGSARRMRQFVPMPYLVFTGIVVTLVGVLFVFLNTRQPVSLSPRDFSFSSQPVTRGIPNTIVFTYDATASPTDSVFIQQSWDPKRRQLVSRNNHQHTSVYYDPGFFRAKLVIGQQIVREHHLLIPSEGWHVSVFRDPVPVSFPASQLVSNGILHLPVKAIKEHNIPMQPEAPIVRYRNIRAMPGLRTDNFVLETRLKSDFAQGSSVCQQALIMIHGKEDMFFIPLSAKGCVSTLNLYAGGNEVKGTQTDLSAFGTTMQEWVDVRCEVADHQVTIWINGREAYRAKRQGVPTDIVGITFQFEGTGSVDYCRFAQSNGKIIFADNFD